MPLAQDFFEKGLIFFAAGQFYEAHEAWEDLWNLTDGPAKAFYQGLVQAAVGLHHLERGNWVGAQGVLSKSIRHLAKFPDNPQAIDTADLVRQLQALLEHKTYRTVRVLRFQPPESAE